ncbi:MAG: hypothetical protein ABIK76_05295 [candidate division WOR-3 bacterium]
MVKLIAYSIGYLLGGVLFIFVISLPIVLVLSLFSKKRSREKLFYRTITIVGIISYFLFGHGEGYLSFDAILIIIQTIFSICIIKIFYSIIKNKNKENNQRKYQLQFSTDLEPSQKISKNRELLFYLVFISIIFFGTFFVYNYFYNYYSDNQKITWKKYRSEIGKFEVLFPSDPEYTTKQLNLASNLNLDYHLYQAKAKDNVYLVGVIVLPSDFDITNLNNKNGLEAIAKGLFVLPNKGDRLIFSELTKFKNYDAVDLIIENNTDYGDITVITKFKFFYRDRFIYMLVAGYNKEKYNATDYNKFIDSFELLK